MLTSILSYLGYIGYVVQYEMVDSIKYLEQLHFLNKSHRLIT